MAENAKIEKPTRKKRYVERPDVRAQLLDAAEALIRTEGYAAATARRIAECAGMKHQSIFYYFGTQEELLVEVFNRFAKIQRDNLEAARNADNPIRTFWNMHRDPDVTRFTLEFMALANHSEVIRVAIATISEENRQIESDIIGKYLKKRDIEPRLSATYVSMLTSAMARLLVQEENLGIRFGHAEIEAQSLASMAIFEALGEAGPEDSSWINAVSAARDPNSK